jgi:hypothetical protein
MWPAARWVMGNPPAKSTCVITHLPEMSPLGSMSAGVATVWIVNSPRRSGRDHGPAEVVESLSVQLVADPLRPKNNAVKLIKSMLHSCVLSAHWMSYIEIVQS